MRQVIGVRIRRNLPPHGAVFRGSSEPLCILAQAFFHLTTACAQNLCEKVIAGFGEDSFDRIRVHNIGDGGIGNSFLKVLVFHQLGAELVEPGLADEVLIDPTSNGTR